MRIRFSFELNLGVCQPACFLENFTLPEMVKRFNLVTMLRAISSLRFWLRDLAHGA